MTFPVAFSDMKTFEKNNSRISVNVYALKNKTDVVGPIYKTMCKRKHHVNLLMLENGTQSHYCLIKNLACLLKIQLTKHNGRVYFCDECMLFFNTEGKLNAHVCGGVKTILPDHGTQIQFKHYERMQDMPFIIYADFESLLQPNPGENKLNTNRINTLQKHIPAAFAYYIVCSYNPSLNKYVSYRGRDCVEKFIDYLQEDIAKINIIFKNPLPILLTEEDEKQFANSQNCYLCQKIIIRRFCKGPLSSYGTL